MRSKWAVELERAYQARHGSVRVRPAEQKAEETLREFFAGPPQALLAVLERCGGIDELKTDRHGNELEYPVLSPALHMVSDTRYSREVVSPTLQGLILIGRRGGIGQSVYFVMEEQPDAQRVGIYWVAYDEVEWVSDTLDEFLLALAKGKVATDRQLVAIDNYSERANAARMRMLKHSKTVAKRREHKLSAPLRPKDWRAHLTLAFGRGKVHLSRAASKPREKLSALTSAPPRVLVDLLSATDGVYDTESHVDVVCKARTMVSETLEAREEHALSKKLIVIGRAGVDGILFVMRAGDLSNDVGAFDPLERKTRWLSKRLSDFLNRWAEGSLLL